MLEWSRNNCCVLQSSFQVISRGYQPETVIGVLIKGKSTQFNRKAPYSWRLHPSRQSSERISWGQYWPSEASTIHDSCKRLIRGWRRGSCTAADGLRHFCFQRRSGWRFVIRNHLTRLHCLVLRYRDIPHLNSTKVHRTFLQQFINYFYSCCCSQAHATP
jgi:hypothetical protein